MRGIEKIIELKKGKYKPALSSVLRMDGCIIQMAVQAEKKMDVRNY
jgi:hypothetical protein